MGNGMDMMVTENLSIVLLIRMYCPDGFPGRLTRDVFRAIINLWLWMNMVISDFWFMFILRFACFGQIFEICSG